MACAIQNESLLGRDLGTLKVVRPDLNSPTAADLNCNRSTRISGRSSAFRGGDVHEAILFLQNKHERVLAGLHKQIEILQQRCDNLQFESHLSHLISDEEEILKKKLKDVKRKLEEKDQTIQNYEQKIQNQEKAKEEELQQHRWRELQLTQQVEISEQRSGELKLEINRLKAKVHDLQVYCSGIRTGGGGGGGGGLTNRSIRQSHSRPIPPSPKLTSTSHNQQYQTSQESLDSFGPRSMGSEDGDSGTFRESRVGGSFASRVLSKGAGSRVQSTPSRSINLNNSQSFSLPPVTPRDNRPFSGIVTLPPITQSQAITRQQVRRQLRLSSAPNLDSNANIKPKLPP